MFESLLPFIDFYFLFFLKKNAHQNNFYYFKSVFNMETLRGYFPHILFPDGHKFIIQQFYRDNELFK